MHRLAKIHSVETAMIIGSVFEWVYRRGSDDRERLAVLYICNSHTKYFPQNSPK